MLFTNYLFAFSLSLSLSFSLSLSLSLSLSTYTYIYFYATMCSSGLQGVVRSHHVHQLTQGKDVGRGLPNAI